MAEYIDRDELLKELKEHHDNIMTHPDIEKATKWREAICYNRTLEVLKEAPTADVVEVKHGEWEAGHYEGGIFDGTNFEKCSVCQFERLFEDVNFKTTYNYCPNCGAKMDLKEGAEK